MIQIALFEPTFNPTEPTFLNRSLVRLSLLIYSFGDHFAPENDSHCLQVLLWQPFVMNVLQNGKVKKTAYMPCYCDFGLILLRFST